MVMMVALWTRRSTVPAMELVEGKMWSHWAKPREVVSRVERRW